MILSGMFDVWTKNFLNFFVVFLGLALVNGLIGGLLAFLIIGTFSAGSGIFPGTTVGTVSVASLGALVLLAIVSVLASAIINSIVYGGMTEYAVRRYRGESMTLERALRRGLERFLSILGANIMLTILLFALVLLPLLLAIPGLFLFASGGDPGTALALVCGGLIGFVIGGVIALYVYIGMGLYAPAIMMENHRAVDGLMRSWHLTKGHRWSLLGALIVAGILFFLISVAVTFPAAFFGNAAVNLIATAIASGLVGSWFVILAAVAYDLLVRQPTFGAPPYFPGPTMSPPAGAAQMPQGPPAAPPPPGP